MLFGKRCAISHLMAVPKNRGKCKSVTISLHRSDSLRAFSPPPPPPPSGGNKVRNSHRRSPFTLGHHLPTVGAKSDAYNREQSIIYRFATYKKVLRFSCQTAKFQAPKTPRTDTILPEHLQAHTLIISVYLHYCI